MTEKVLYVDDDANLVATCQRCLRKTIELEVATDPQIGVKMLTERGPFAALVTDMRMPRMSGLEFLAKAHEVSPETVCIMLTGNADLKTASDAVNHGNVFRFITKPCTGEVLTTAIKQAIEKYKQNQIERHIIEKTVMGSVALLMDILNSVDPNAFDKAQQLKANAQKVVATLGLPGKWDIELAAMLASIGRLTLPAELMVRVAKSEPLSDRDEEVIRSIPEMGRNLLIRIPRLEQIANIVHFQNKNYDGSGFPPMPVKEHDIPLGSRLLKILIDICELERTGHSVASSLEIMRDRMGCYDPYIFSQIERLSKELVTSQHAHAINVKIDELKIGDTLFSDLKTKDGHILAGTGAELTASILENAQRVNRMHGIIEPVAIRRK